MAVQAQYPPSNAFCSDYPSRLPIGSVIEDIQTMQIPQIRIDCLPPVTKVVSAGLANASVFSEHPQSVLTCNATASRKRRRDEKLTLVAPAAALPLIAPVSNPSLHTNSLGLKNGFCGGVVSSALTALREQSLQVYNSSVASTSGRSSNLSSQLVPTTGWYGQDINSQICQQDLEMAAFIGLQFDIIRLGVEERRKKHFKSMYCILEQLVINRIREKEIELEDTKRKNAELEEKVRQMSAESQRWFNVAKNNELLVSNLKSNLEQILFQNALPAAVVPSLKEGYGDSDGALLPVEDDQYFCFDVDAHMLAAEPAVSLPYSISKVNLQPLSCKVCGVDEMSVVVLPCRHLCLCENCDSSVAMCPICNYPKDSSLQVFI